MYHLKNHKSIFGGRKKNNIGTTIIIHKNVYKM